MANPTDLVKVRLQAEGKSPAGVPRHYTGALNAYYTIVMQVIFEQVINCFHRICLLTKYNWWNRKEWQRCGQDLGPTLQEMQL